MHRFYIGKEEREVNPSKNDDNIEEYFAWCLRELIKGLKNANQDADKRLALQAFEKNMRAMKKTKVAFEKIEHEFVLLTLANPLPDNDHIINSLLAIPVNGYYMSLATQYK